MRYLILLYIPFLFGACRKSERYTPCEDFDKMYGTWKNIDGDLDHFITIENDGMYKSCPPLERCWNRKITTVEKTPYTFEHFGQNYFAFQALLVDNSGLIVKYTSNYDTMLITDGSYDDNLSGANPNFKRFVKD